MKQILSLLPLSLFLLACSQSPEPLVYGKDGCYTCKMTLMDKKFGAEIVTLKGKVYKFDDLNCMISFYNSDYEPQENIARSLVIDFAQPEVLVDAQSAVYVCAAKIRSPMASQVAAFSRRDQLEIPNKEWQGNVMDWNGVVSLLNQN